MKIRIYITVLIIILAPNLGYPQNVSTDIVMVNTELILKGIEEYVNDELNRWQKQDKHQENTSNYIKRVNSATRDKKIVALKNERINEIADEVVNLTIQDSEYDPDNEVYMIKFLGLPRIYIRVPMADNQAASLERNKEVLIFKYSDYTFTNKGFALLELTVQNPGNGVTYQYNYQDKLTFKKSKVQLNFEPVRIETGDFVGHIIEEEESIIVNQVINVDLNIPETQKVNSNVYALVIGNEDYQSFQTGLTAEQNVEFAVNDAQVFSKYLHKTMGVPQRNIDLRPNATYGQIRQSLTRLATIAEVKQGDLELIFYYAGHGVPDENEKTPYLIPVDISGTDLESAVKLLDVYMQLTEFSPKKVTIFLDACFSGGARNRELLASRGVRIAPKADIMKGNIVVFASSSGNESSGSYQTTRHGMFTYFLLKKLQETRGDLSYNEMADYLKEHVSLESVLENNQTQTPQVLFSQDVAGQWGNWEF